MKMRENHCQAATIHGEIVKSPVQQTQRRIAPSAGIDQKRLATVEHQKAVSRLRELVFDGETNLIDTRVIVHANDDIWGSRRHRSVESHHQPKRYSTPMVGRGLSHLLTMVSPQMMRQVPHSRQPA